MVVAAPVESLAGAVAAALQAAGDGTAVTDVGSVKAHLEITDPRFIGGHPLAGAELAGAAHARADLFEGAIWYLTPHAGTRGDLLTRVHRLVTGLGAVPAALDPVTHDRVMAAVSHLPHVMANVLVAQAADALGGERMPATGPSFRDATRVAGANPALWGGIYAANREALVAQLEGAIARLTEARDELAGGGDLRRAQEQAAARRRALVETGLAGGLLREVRAIVPNRPGVVAEITLRLGGEGINIHDMSLAPSADDQSGRIALWVGEADAARAEALVRGITGP